MATPSVALDDPSPSFVRAVRQQQMRTGAVFTPLATAALLSAAVPPRDPLFRRQTALDIRAHEFIDDGVDA